MKQQEPWYQVMGKPSGPIAMESSGTVDFPFPPGFRLYTFPVLDCPKPPFFSATRGFWPRILCIHYYPCMDTVPCPSVIPLHSLHLLFLPPDVPGPNASLHPSSLTVFPVWTLLPTQCLPAPHPILPPLQHASAPWVVAAHLLTLNQKSTFSGNPTSCPNLGDKHLISLMVLSFSSPLLGLLLQYMYIFVIIQSRLSVTERNLSLFLF